MDTRGLGTGPLTRVRPISGGTQNVMVRFERAGREYVLRRGPHHLRPRSNEVLLHETRLLSALADTDVPHPHIIAVCDDTAVFDGAVFYLMEPVDGFNATVVLPPLHAGDPSVRHRMGLAMADALAALGTVDHFAVGLAGFGRPEGFLERQVPRWLAELESYNRFSGYLGSILPGVDPVADWLERNRPAEWRPGIMHGDFHLANVMFSPHGPDVAAIVDWEMCTIGDPLLDLGWLLATWPEPGGVDLLDGALTKAGGLPTAAELVARYARRTTRDLTAIAWYTVLACFKLGIVLEGTHARACAGKAPAAVGDRLHASARALFERAGRLIASA
ncbi:phosphotransferase family protein [Streptomyces pristinaespiralis]|nr:phosphotransferase family protein [Streptomyces pristinaespiralis]